MQFPLIQRPVLTLGALVFAAVPAADDVLAFDPAPATELTKTFVEQTTWVLEDVSQRVAGNDVNLPQNAMSGRTRREAVLNDTYIAVLGGRVTELARTVSTLEGRAEVQTDGGGGEQYGYELSSELEGAELRASWDEHEELYDFRFADERSGDAELLKGLRADADFTALLPDEDVAVGDSWSLDPKTLVDVLAPGGDGHLFPDAVTGPLRELEIDDVLGTGNLTLADMAQSIDGDAEATWKETYEEDGHSLARIVVTLDLTIAGAVDARVAAWRDHLDMGSNREGLVIRYERALEGEAELIWSLSGGHFVAFDFQSESYVEGQMRWHLGEIDVEVDVELNASTEFTARAE